MKNNYLIIFSLSLFVLFISSCNNDPANVYATWKSQNDNYFTNMKDSTGYILYTIPVTFGGGSYYYKITTQGNENDGNPLVTDNVTVNYRGSLINGTVFDQTYTGSNPVNDKAATPRTFRVNQLISGWTENLLQMKPGEIRTIVLPQELSYGSSGVSSILPYSTLRFDVQLVSFSH